MQRNTLQSNMKPPPPATLSNEFQRVWVGWCRIGDREVAREAAAKGIYISLALDFIAARKDWDHSDVERWFKTEILAWVYHLLERKQIFKASHILSNVGIDPAEQFAIILSETTDKTLRDYIAEHLFKSQKLDSSLLNSWKFINALENTKNPLFATASEEVYQISINKVEQKSAEWKSNIATVLFFDTYDFCLENFLLSEFAWKYLLSNEKLIILKIWINIYFSKDLTYEFNTNLSSEVYQKLKNLFLLWEISESMINQITSETYPDIVKNFVLNELSTFGIFNSDERDDIIKILSRFSKTGNIMNIYKILEEPTSCLRVDEFNKKLIYFCLNHKLFEVLSACSIDYNLLKSMTENINSKEISLWLKIKENKDEASTEETVYNNIITVLDYCACGDIKTYLKANPIILLAMVIFHKGIAVHDIISYKRNVPLDEITLESEAIVQYIAQMPMMANVIKKFTTNLETPTITLYQLLEKYNICTDLFSFRLSINDTEIPHFANTTLIKQYAYLKNVNYLYYIKRNRPSKATKLFVLDQFEKHTVIKEIEKCEALQAVYNLAVKNCTDPSILSSCISFSEMIGSSSQDLRILANVTHEICESKTYNIEQIQVLFSNLSENCVEILDVLEITLLEKYKSSFEDYSIMLVQNNKLAVAFAFAHNLELPTKFLVHCAQSNLWLPFLIHVEIFNYPLEQTLRLMTHFKNEEMLDHLRSALSISLEMESSKHSEMISSVDRLTTSATSLSSTETEFSSSDTIEFTPKTNLLSVLMKCHTSGDPPTALLQACQFYKNPLFANIATCYEPDSVVICWLSWLSVSVNMKIDAEKYSVSSNLVVSFLENVVQKAFIRTCWESLKIFLPENPLCSFFEFLYNCTLLEFESGAENLKTFNQIVNQLKYNVVIPSNDFEYTYLHNSFWIIDTTLRLVFVALGSCFHTRMHQISLLNTLCATRFPQNVPVNYPNFCAISNLLHNLSSSNIDIDLSVFSNTADQKSEIIRCVELLTNKNQFNEALELVKYGNICEEYFTDRKWMQKFINFTKQNFWRESNRALYIAQVSPSFAAEFYVNCSKYFQEHSDRYKTLKYAYESLKQCDYSLEPVKDIEQEIWLNYFALDDATLRCSYYEKNERNYLLSEILNKVNTECRFGNSLDKEQFRHLEETIAKILESGDIIEAMRLEKMFNYKDVEISILLTCYELAEGRLSPYDISTEQRLLFLNRDMNLRPFPLRRRPIRATRTSNISTGSFESSVTVVPAIESEEIPFHDTLALLETMTDRLKHGSNIGGRILMCYRISVNVGKPYQEIVTMKNSVALLKAALQNGCKNKLEVVHDVCAIFHWTKQEIINLVFEEIKIAVKKSILLNLDCTIMWDLELDTQFHLVLQLCSENSSALGEKLLAVTNDIHIAQIYSDTDTDEKELAVLIELLIRAHDCFDTYCNIERIASVLRKAQALTSLLLNFKKWKLMVRLLTGIGRYTDMNYIFQILKENDQFEYLLKRNFRKDNALKVALLKFLKQHCPKNQELYEMVALHFKLFSEFAQLWENVANEMINNLVEITKLEAQNQGRNNDDYILFSNNESTTLCLKRVMSTYSHAAQYHLHGEKLGRAMKTARQAELIALQLSMLKGLPSKGTAKCILKLSATNKKIYNLIFSDLSFPQAKILIESYDYEVDWVDILFQHCIINANSKYLEEYLEWRPFTNAFVQELGKRFLAKNITSPTSVNAMKQILKQLDSIHVKYKLASELGFTDVIESLLCGSQLAYLKDTVWKRGYKQI